MLKVAELIAILQTLPQDLPVQMAMNMEYQSPVDKDMIEVQTFNDRSYVVITDTPETLDY